MAAKKKAAEGGSASGAKATNDTATTKAVAPEARAGSAVQMKSTKIPKLAKKNKKRLPRRQKKALRKAEAAQRIQTGDWA